MSKQQAAKWELLRQQYDELKAAQGKRHGLQVDRQVLLRWVAQQAEGAGMSYGRFVILLRR
ncbi:MAG: hypothetical protein KC449_05220 [Anaerolineales bacterium]|nr:hypothetical protein [Anaerolineales bacterium]